MVRKPNLRIPPARATALAVLRTVLVHGADVQAALDNRLPASSLDIRDKALATELVYGFLRFKGRIDFILQSFLPRSKKLPPQCVLAMGVATYERLFLDRVPEYATRSWLTGMVRAAWGPGLARVATAYLSTLGRHAPDLHAPDFYRQDACPFDAFLARYCSLPQWLAGLWNSAYGAEQAVRLAQIQLQSSLLGLRVNPLRPDAEALTLGLVHEQNVHRSGHWGLACERDQAHRLLPHLDILLAEGRISRQSLAAQHVLDALRLDAASGPIWDVCAGRGGKTCYLLERTAVSVRASDTNLSRLGGLRRDIVRLGLRDIPVALARADQSLPWREKPGCILVDAPCSGLGVLARRPDIKWKRLPGDLPILEAVQRRMLAAAGTSLRSKGRLVYVTCTLNPAENEQQIDWLLREAPGLRCLKQYSGERGMELREFFWAAILEKK